MQQSLLQEYWWDPFLLGEMLLEQLCWVLSLLPEKVRDLSCVGIVLWPTDSASTLSAQHRTELAPASCSQTPFCGCKVGFRTRLCNEPRQKHTQEWCHAPPLFVFLSWAFYRLPWSSKILLAPQKEVFPQGQSLVLGMNWRNPRWRQAVLGCCWLRWM